MEFHILLRLFVVKTSCSFYLIHSIIKGSGGRGSPTYVMLVKKMLTLACVQTLFYWPISFRLGLMIKTTRLSILLSVWMTLTFTQGHSCMRNKKFVVHFSEISQLIRIKFSMLPQPVGLLKPLLNLFCTDDIEGREFCWHEFIKHNFNMVLCRDTCKLGMMLSTNKFYSLMYTQGHRVTGKLEFVQSFCCKVAWSNSNVCDGWSSKGKDYEEVL